ncbi:helix-turn-helix domain-containing protein [Aminobacter sp. BE322]|uniref:helix-turn-helix domain-containing protein n=1 Tax=unclassified Aminobacter TaxID=2644704 RepID=UPI003D1FEC9C
MSDSRGKQWFVDRMNALDLSLSEVARRMGIDKGALSRALDGGRGIKLPEIDKIATILGTTREEVIDHGEEIAKNAASRKKGRLKEGARADAVPVSGQSGEVLQGGAGFMEEQTGFHGAGHTNDEAENVLGEPSIHAGRVPPPRSHPLFGRLKGMVTVLPGVDLTEPADPDLADYLDRKYGPVGKD